MSWLLCAVAAPLLWAASSVLDGRLIQRERCESWTLMAVTGFTGVIPGLLALAVRGVELPDLPTVSLGVSAGVVGILAFYPYYRALESTPPASAVLMWNASPVLVVLLARWLLGEHLGLAQYAAIGLLMASATLAGYASTRGHRSSPRAVAWMACASALVAIEAVAQKALYATVTLPTGLLLTGAGGLLCAFAILLLRASVRRAMRRMIVARDGRLMLLNEGLNLGATVLNSWAIRLGPLSAVKAIAGVQPLFVLGLSRATGTRTEPGREGTRLLESLVATLLAIAGLAVLGGAA